MHGLERRVELHQAVEFLGRPGDAWISAASSRVAGGIGMGRLPLEQRPGHGVEAEQDRQQAGPGAWQPDNDPRAVDPLS